MKFRTKRLFTIGLSFALIGAQALSVSADTDDDIAAIQSQQEQTNAELSQIESSISDMENQKAAVLDQIDSYDQELVVTMASIKSLEDQISQAETELKQTEQDLTKAQKQQDTEYAAMKKRIQYLYEEGGENGWFDVMIGGTSLSAGMNNVDDTQSLYKYDREELANYTDTVQQVTDLKAQLTQQKSSLEAMKQEQEGAKANLESLKADAQAQSDDYEAKISDAEATADQYYALIQQQNDQIAELQAQKAAEEEAAKKAAEEEAARQAAAEAAAQQAANTSNASSSGSGSTNYSGAQAQQAADTAASISNGSTTTIDTSGTAGSAATGSATGSAIAAYATQFVGNPYVWGGTSLTNGCDCSGFVQQVFAHFGISLSRTTYTQANEGVAVSYDQMQPGDVINYGFHTAIYIGNNQIVHAANESLGIIIQSNPAFQPIVTIRRFY